MAQTKTKSKSNTKSKGQAKTSKRGSHSRPKNARGSSSKARTKPGRSRRPPPNSGRAPLEKLKGPATATGAALLAVAGGVAAARGRNGRRRKLLKNLRGIDLPTADAAIDWVEEKATGVGDAGYKAAQLTSQARSVKKALS